MFGCADGSLLENCTQLKKKKRNLIKKKKTPACEDTEPQVGFMHVDVRDGAASLLISCGLIKWLINRNKRVSELHPSLV